MFQKPFYGKLYYFVSANHKMESPLKIFDYSDSKLKDDEIQLDPKVIHSSMDKFKNGMKSKKYGNKGNPHFRIFFIDETKNTVYWESKQSIKSGIMSRST